MKKPITTKRNFFSLLDKAISPPRKSRAKKSGRRSSENSNEKQTRRYKSANT